MASKTGLPSSLNSTSTENSTPEDGVTVKKERKDYDTASSPSKISSGTSETRAAVTNHAPSQPAAEAKVKQIAPPVERGPPPLDFASIRGIFGWMTVADVNLPFIVRGEQRYVAVRMVECKIISKYSDILPWAVFTCTNIKSYYITDNEAKLLNEINGYHCDHQFGFALFSTKDVVVSVEDAVRFQKFLSICKARFVPSKGGVSALGQTCGLLKVHGAIVPYLTRNGARVVPLGLLKEGVTPVQGCLYAVDDWDLAYIKVFCYVAGIDPQTRVTLGSSLCLVNDLRYSHSGQDVHVEEWWPSTLQQYLDCANQRSSSGNVKMPSLGIESIVQEPNNNYNGFSRSPASMPEVPKVSYHVSNSSRVPGEYRPMPTNMANPCGCIGNCSHVLDRRGSAILCNNNMLNGSLRAVPAEGYWEPPRHSSSSHRLPTTNGLHTPSRSNLQVYGNPQMLQAYQDNSILESSLKSYPPPPPLVRLGKNVDEANLSQPMTSPTGERSYHMGSANNLRPPPPLQPAPAVCIGKTTVYRDSSRNDMPVIVGVHSLASDPMDASVRPHKEQLHLSPKSQGSIVAPHHYPTPPQSSPLQSSTPIPVSLTDSSFQPPFIMHPCDFVDLCSPPASPPDSRHANGHQDSITPASRLPGLLPFVDVEGCLLPTVCLDPTNPNSPLLTTISAVVNNLFPTIPEQSCQFVLENVLGVKLYNSSRYQSISTRDKMIAVNDLKSYLPHLRYMFQKVELSPDILKSRSVDEEPARKRLCHENGAHTS